MVMPRSRSSGALSIESNERNLMFGLCFDSTLVIAAVSVVLPWSMCPIVPTFTCGLVRSKLAFAIAPDSSKVGAAQCTADRESRCTSCTGHELRSCRRAAAGTRTQDILLGRQELYR